MVNSVPNPRLNGATGELAMARFTNHPEKGRFFMVSRKTKIALIATLGATVAMGVTGAFAADPKAKWCEGVKIAAFPGGPQGGVFANNVYNGFRQAELDLGPTVTYYFSDWIRTRC